MIDPDLAAYIGSCDGIREIWARSARSRRGLVAVHGGDDRS